MKQQHQTHLLLAGLALHHLPRLELFPPEAVEAVWGMWQEVLLGLMAGQAAAAHGRKRQEQERQAHQDRVTMVEQEQTRLLTMVVAVAVGQVVSALMEHQQLAVLEEPEQLLL